MWNKDKFKGHLLEIHHRGEHDIDNKPHFHITKKGEPINSRFDFNGNFIDDLKSKSVDKQIRKKIKEYCSIPENYQELLELIQNCTITFSMFDLNNKYIILNDEALINLETLSNRIVNDEDNCRELMDFTIQYKFKKKNTAKAGFYVGEFKIVFIKDGEEKTLIVPINNKLNILITPSTNC
jgi:hypothetical protein